MYDNIPWCFHHRAVVYDRILKKRSKENKVSLDLLLLLSTRLIETFVAMEMFTPI